MPTVLALSPHLDDAVFSCGGTLALLARRGWRAVIATAFTASVSNPKGFALACQIDKGLPTDCDYMALRRKEDAAAAQVLGIEQPVWLPFAEAPHRGYRSAAELFEPVRADDNPALATEFAALVTQLDPDVVFAPQAVGGHVDHDLVRRAAVQLPHRRIWLWQDCPYYLRSTHKPAFNHSLTPSRIDLVRKRDACACYASQLGFQFGGVDGLYATLKETCDIERFCTHANKLTIPRLGRNGRTY